MVVDGLVQFDSGFDLPAQFKIECVLFIALLWVVGAVVATALGVTPWGRCLRQTANRKRIDKQPELTSPILSEPEAQAKADELLSRSLTNNLVQYEMAKRWNGQMPQVTGGHAHVAVAHGWHDALTFGMPIVPFHALPDTARLWAFGAASPVTGDAASRVLQTVDAHLTQWRAHGVPLVCARDWRDDRFLAIAVDEAATNASGCSIDALFHVLQDTEEELGVSLVPSGLVYWRDASGHVVSGERAAFRAAAASGSVGPDTPVFDTLVTTAGDWRTSFERRAADSWHRRWITG